jgi:hypothetical protein
MNKANGHLYFYWSFNTIEHGVLVKTHESWGGEPVESQANTFNMNWTKLSDHGWKA